MMNNHSKGCSIAIRMASSLVDSFGRCHNYLRISLTERCNLRCQYCMPEDGVSLSARDELLTLPEVKRIISLFAGLGLRKLKLTGGEPTLSKNLVSVIEHVAQNHSDVSIGMTTNGLFLTDSLLQRLINAGLGSVNISLDTLRQDRFHTITKRDGTGVLKVLSAIYSARSKGLRTKVNCVLMRGVNDDEIVDFIRQFACESDIDVRFIELMPFLGNKWDSGQFLSYKEALSRLRDEHPYGSINLVQSPVVDHNDTTKWFTVSATATNKHTLSSTLNSVDNNQGKAGCSQGVSNNTVAGLGRVGFITSMSSHFCAGCNRLRITADGNLKTCLFGRDSLSLRDHIRAGADDDKLAGLVEQALRAKHFALGGREDAIALAKHSDENRPMILIGG